MIIMETKEYIAPKIEVVDMEFEGNVCQSASVHVDTINENDGEWDK